MDTTDSFTPLIYSIVCIYPTNANINVKPGRGDMEIPGDSDRGLTSRTGNSF